MTLVFDDRHNLQGQPGMHALIVGVSAYPHLPGGGGKAATDSYGMQQLSSTALSAYKVYEWLIRRKHRLPMPLATCRLLLSPSAGEVTAEPTLAGLADACTRQNFVTTAREWRTDASTHDGNMTFFYYAGHGVQRSKTDGVLLFEGFGDPDEGTLHHAADIVNIFNGMAPPANAAKKIARTQLYFVDACRVLPAQFKNFEKMSVPDVFNVELSGKDNRQAPIFFATLPGIKAYALTNQQTLFSKALLECLKGAAGEPKEDHLGNVYWQVSAQRINKALSEHFDELTGEPSADQEFSLGGYATGDPAIHLLDTAPMVDVSLELDPLAAVQFTEVEIIDEQRMPIQFLPMPLTPHPFRFKVPAGMYTINARINPQTAGYTDRPGKIFPVLPPRQSWKRRMAV